MFQSSTDWAKGYCDAEARFHRTFAVIGAAKAESGWEHAERPTDLRLAWKARSIPSSKAEIQQGHPETPDAPHRLGTERWWQLVSYVDLSESSLDAPLNAPPCRPDTSPESEDSGPAGLGEGETAR